MKILKFIIKLLRLLIKNKAMFKNLKDWKTTVVGIVVVLVFGLNAFNIITPEEGDAIKSGIQTIIDAFGGGVVGIVGTSFTVIGGILMLFVKDPKKEDNG